MNQAGFRIHALVPAELDDLARLHGECFAEAWDADALATLLAMPGAFALLAQEEDKGALLGFVMIRGAGDEAEIITLGVDPGRRRRGLGRALLAAGLSEAAARGSARLFLEVAADNFALSRYRLHRDWQAHRLLSQAGGQNDGAGHGACSRDSRYD